MSLAQLEKRVTAIEEELTRFRSRLGITDQQPWWQRIAGTFANDPAHEEARKLGQEYRQSRGYDAPEE